MHFMGCSSSQVHKWTHGQPTELRANARHEGLA